MSIHKKTKQHNNNYNLTIHTRSQKSTNTSAIWANSNILKSVQDELYLKSALGFSIPRSISRKSRELVWAEEPVVKLQSAALASWSIIQGGHGE